MVRNAFIVVSGAALALTPISAQTAKLHQDMGASPIGDVGQLFGSDEYPPDALKASRQGRVVATVGVDSAGQVVSCTIAVSSGTTSLDTKTCEIAAARLHFDPATDHEGRPRASVYQLPVMWKIPDMPLQAPVDLTGGVKRTTVEGQITFDADGVVISCRPLLIAGVSEEKFDPCRGALPGTKSSRRWLLNGKPVGAIVVDRFSEQTTATN